MVGLIVGVSCVLHVVPIGEEGVGLNHIHSQDIYIYIYKWVLGKATPLFPWSGFTLLRSFFGYTVRVSG